MKPPLPGIIAVFVIAVVAGVLTRQPDQRKDSRTGDPGVMDLIRAAKERRPASLIGGDSPIDLSDDFAGLLPAVKGRALIASAGDIEPADFAGLFAGNRHDATIGRMIAKRWAETDPEAFFAYLKKHPDGDGRSFDSWETLFRIWGAADPETAFARVLDIPDFARRRDTLPHLCDTILHSDVDTALQLFAGRPRFSVILPRHDWIRADPGGIADKLLPMPDSPFRTDVMKTALAIWFNDSPEETIAFAGTLEGSVARAVEPFVKAWVRQDPEAALAFAADRIHDGASTDVVFEALGAWAGRDPGGAWRWASENLAGRPRTIAASRIIKNAAGVDPVTAVKIIQALPAGQQESALVYFSESFFKTDRAAALEWAHAQADPGFRTRIFGRMGHEWAGAREALPEMERYVREHADSLPESFVMPLALSLESKHPREAMNLQKALPDRLGIPVSARIMEIWARRSPESAAEYVLEMEHPEKRLRAFETVTGALLERGTDPAVSWLKRAAAKRGISAEQIRSTVTKAALSPEQRHELLSRISLK